MRYENYWLVIVLLGVGTFFLRASVIYLSNYLTVTDEMRRILSFIPAAIFPALLTPMVFFHQGHSELFLHKERVVAMMLATLICFKTKNILITVIAGLFMLYILQML